MTSQEAIQSLLGQQISLPEEGSQGLSLSPLEQAERCKPGLGGLMSLWWQEG